MKQIIPFKKDIPFDTKIGEITSISLEHTLKLEREDYITGEFIVSGEYKVTDISINTESFNYNVPFSINLDSKYNVQNDKVEIDDFYYEIINEDTLRVNIDVLVDNLAVVKEEIDEIEEPVGVRGDEYQEEDIRDHDTIDLFKMEETPPIPVAGYVDAGEEKLKSLFDAFDDKDETFTTYHVHIMREEDNIDTIAMKYNTTKEEITLYNKVDELKLGDKIIIPSCKDD
jgi:hypothetical protein